MLCIFLLQNPALCRNSSGACTAIYLQIFYQCRRRGKEEELKNKKARCTLSFDTEPGQLPSCGEHTCWEIFKVQPRTDKFIFLSPGYVCNFSKEMHLFIVRSKRELKNFQQNLNHETNMKTISLNKAIEIKNRKKISHKNFKISNLTNFKLL